MLNINHSWKSGLPYFPADPERRTMASKIFLKNKMYWLVIFMRILSTGSVSMLLGCQAASSLQKGCAPSIAVETSELTKKPLANPAVIKNGSLAFIRGSQLAPPRESGEVTTSWYGPAHHNRLTASGQRFNMNKNTLAHRTLPLGTKVRLINPENGKSVVGIVNDRGPYINGRDVDVSYAMAKKLGFVKKGVVKLEMKTIQVPAEAKNKA